jgi:hypothetical protein
MNRHGELTFWSFKDSQEVKTFKLGATHAFSLSPDEKILASTRMVTTKKGDVIHYSGDVDLWDADSGKRLETIPMETQGLCPVFSPQGGMLAVGCRGAFKLTDKAFTIGDEPEPQAPEGFIRIWNLRDLHIGAKQ